MFIPTMVIGHIKMVTVFSTLVLNKKQPAQRGRLFTSTCHFLFALLAIGFGLISSTVTYAAPGDLDPSFGSNGTIITDFGGNESARALVIQSDGKIVVGGLAALARYQSNGSLDSGFANSGKLTTELGGFNLRTLALQSDGKIVAGGFTANGNNWDFTLARYQSDGSLDTGFGDGGKFNTDFGRIDFANALALQPDGKIVVVGNSHSSGVSDTDFALVRYNSNGSLDLTFGLSGKVVTDLGGEDQANAVLTQPDGKILVAGSTSITGNAFVFVRYNDDGSLDTSFGINGKISTPFADTSNTAAKALLLQPDGKIVAVGGTYPSYLSKSGFMIARYHGNGSLDTSFGNGGKVFTDFGGGFDSATALVSQSDGKIAVAGTVNTPTFLFAPNPCDVGQLGLARYNADGSLDTRFGSGGKVVTNLHTLTAALALSNDGKLLAAGGNICNPPSTSSSDFALARYLNDSGLPQPGWWWNSSQSGRGFSIEVSQNTLVMAGYLYDASGLATWYTSAGPMTNNTLYQGPLQSFGNGQTLTGAYKPYSLTSPNVGPITIQFSDATHGTLTWPGGTIPIERYVFGAGASSFQPESGWWWNESESGRGFTLEVQGNKLVIGGYMYDEPGNPVWYLSTGNITSAMLYQGQWEQYANGQTLTGLYQKPTQVNGNVGSITIQFTSRTTATFTLPNGRQIPLTRYRF